VAEATAVAPTPPSLSSSSSSSSFSSSTDEPPLILQHPLDGLEQWAALHPRGFHYAFLDDRGEKERTRVDAATLRRQTADVRAALQLWLRQRGRARYEGSPYLTS